MFICGYEFADNIDGLIQHLKFEDLKDKFFRDLVKACSTENELYGAVRNHLDEVVKPSGTPLKEFTYTNSIITLYGYLESFFEKLSEEFITSINEASIPVSALPKAVKDRHLELSMQLLTKVQRNRTQSDSDKNDSEKEVIKNLNSFLQEELGYSLNSKAFSVHTANFRFDLIQSFFAQVGIDRIANRALIIDNVKVQLAARQQQEPLDDPKTLQSWLEHELDDLAQLRNEIAHGSFERTIESFDLVIERAEFIKRFGLALADILYRSFEEVIFHSKERYIIGNADQTFPMHNCFGFEGQSLDVDTERFTLKVGDILYAFNRNCSERVITGKVSSLALNRTAVQELQVPSELDYSIKVDFDVTNSMSNRELSIIRL